METVGTFRSSVSVVKNTQATPYYNDTGGRGQDVAKERENMTKTGSKTSPPTHKYTNIITHSFLGGHLCLEKLSWQNLKENISSDLEQQYCPILQQKKYGSSLPLSFACVLPPSDHTALSFEPPTLDPLSIHPRVESGENLRMSHRGRLLSQNQQTSKHTFNNCLTLQLHSAVDMLDDC